MADLSELSPVEFEARLQSLAGGRATSQTQPVDQLQAIAPDVTPSTREAILKASEMLNKGLDTSGLSDRSLEMGLRPGVPFNVERGASLSTRAKLSFDSDKLNQVKLLGQIYGLENVDLSRDGRFVIRNQINPGTGSKEDFHVNPIGFDSGDVAGMAADVLPIAAGAIGARTGMNAGSRPVTKALGGIAGMAAATELTAGGEEALSRLLAGNDIQPGSIAGERAKAAVADAALGTFIAGGTKIASKLGGAALGLLGISTSETAATTAARALEAKTGIKYPLTPGQAAESPLLIRMEATAEPRMGSIGVMGQINEAKSKAEDELRRVFLGLPRTISDEELSAALPKADVTGQNVLGRLGNESLRLEGNVAKARGAIETTGTAEAQRVAGVNLNAPLEPTAVGESLRSKAVTDFDTFKGTMAQRYESFFAKPEVTERVVKGDSLAKAAQNVEDQLTAQAQKLKEVPTYDTYGSPKVKIVSSTERLDAFVPSKVKGFIDELKGLQGAQVSVNDLKQIRTSIDSAIAEGIAIPGTDVKQLVTLKEKVSGAITDALSQMDNKSLLNEWQTLNKDFATGMQRFDKVGVRRMLVKEGEQGSVGNAQLARSVASGEPGALDRYNEYKNFFGASSQEFRSVQQLAREQVLKGSLDESTGYVSGQALRSNLRSLDPEVATDLLGTSKQELHRIGEALSVAQGNLDLEQLNRLVTSKSLTAAAIPDLIAAEKERAQSWGNKLIKAASRGSDIGAEVMKPSDVVRNITAMDPAQASQVLGILSDRPDLLQDIRSLAVEDLWGRVQANLKGRTGVTSTLIKDALGSDTQTRTWKLLLGNDVVDTLGILSKVVKPQEMAAKAFKSAGSLGATEDISRLERGGLSEVILQAAERMGIATLYTGPLKQVVVNLATHQDQGRLLNSVVMSAPFVERVAERFGQDAPGVMEALRSFVEPKQAKELAIQGKLKSGAVDLKGLNPGEFDQWLKNNMKQ